MQICDETGKAALERLFGAAIAAVSAGAVMPRDLPPGRLCVIAIGKAAAPMMAAVQARHLSSSPVPLAGLVVAPHGHVPSGFGFAGVEVITAGHPLPDADSVRAGVRALALAGALGPDDHLLALVSGGGSAVLAAPVAGLTLAEKVAVTNALLRSGAAIAEINAVRRTLSQIKGGGLAAACAAPVTTWVVSDIPGDDASLVASGPTISGGSGDAREVLARYGIGLPAGVVLAASRALRPGAVRIIARARDALDAAGRLAANWGYAVTDLGDDLQGEARVLGAAHGALALAGGRRAIISGGEASVTVRGTTGRGGRNLEYALGLALALDGAPGIAALAADSDGIDGSSHAAGACIGPDTLARGRALGMDAAAYLAANDAHGYFAALGDLVVTGPTLTNVNDVRVILVG
ncbi:MAG: DUF4147 domain-containing protein [Sandarakinorhabdus sp.]|nr:DUF4147 domain-containing protein [Sandarakinorhabdus sp.]